MSYSGQKRRVPDSLDGEDTPGSAFAFNIGNIGRVTPSQRYVEVVRVWKRDGRLCCYPDPPEFKDDFVTAVNKNSYITGKKWKDAIHPYDKHFHFNWDAAAIVFKNLIKAGFTPMCFDGSVDVEQVLNPAISIGKATTMSATGWEYPKIYLEPVKDGDEIARKIRSVPWEKMHHKFEGNRVLLDIDALHFAITLSRKAGRRVKCTDESVNVDAPDTEEPGVGWGIIAWVETNTTNHRLTCKISLESDNVDAHFMLEFGQDENLDFKVEKSKHRYSFSPDCKVKVIDMLREQGFKVIDLDDEPEEDMHPDDAREQVVAAAATAAALLPSSQDTSPQTSSPPEPQLHTPVKTSERRVNGPSNLAIALAGLQQATRRVTTPQGMDEWQEQLPMSAGFGTNIKGEPVVVKPEPEALHTGVVANLHGIIKGEAVTIKPEPKDEVTDVDVDIKPDPVMVKPEPVTIQPEPEAIQPAAGAGAAGAEAGNQSQPEPEREPEAEVQPEQEPVPVVTPITRIRMRLPPTVSPTQRPMASFKASTQPAVISPGPVQTLQPAAAAGAQQEAAAVQQQLVRPQLNATQDRIARALGWDLYDKLYQYQKEGVEFMVNKGGRALLADDMGLGKTVQALATTAVFADKWPLLIVCPPSLRYVWWQAIRDWLPERLQPLPTDLWIITCGSDIKKRMKLNDGVLPTDRPHCCIITYKLVQKMEGLEKQYKFIICDESHALKSKDSDRTKCMSRLVKAAPCTILISGTPMMSRPIELWSQVSMLSPGLLGSYTDYGKKYCINPGAAPFVPRTYRTGYTQTQPEYRGANNLDELRGILKHVMLRRLKSEVAQQLPDKIRQRIPVVLSAAQAKQWQARMKLLTELYKDKQEAPNDVRLRNAWEREINDAYQIAGVAKVEAVMEYVDMLLENDVKLILFAYHRQVLDAYQDCLTKKDVKLVRLDGSTSPLDRQFAVEAFQKDETVRVFLGSIPAAGAGLTLTAAQACVFAELTWNPAELEQAEDRAHRIGQNGDVNCYYMIADGTSDNMMWSVLNTKLKVVGQVMDGQSAAPLIGRTPKVARTSNIASPGAASSQLESNLQLPVEAPQTQTRPQFRRLSRFTQQTRASPIEDQGHLGSRAAASGLQPRDLLDDF